jgi:hypothetical protein
MRFITFFLAVMAILSSLRAEVPHAAPDFVWTDSTGAPKKAANFRGRPLVVVIAHSPEQRAFRSQVGQLQKIYDRLAAQQLVCVAVFSEDPGVIRSNIPFVTVPDGAATAAAFDASQGFAIAVIGEDGNLDSIGTRVLPGQRILDIINNSFARQKALRRN